MLRNYPLPVSEFNATMKCRECEIFIGVGHFDPAPMPTPDRVGVLCRACYRREQRLRAPGWRAVVWHEA